MVFPFNVLLVKITLKFLFGVRNVLRHICSCRRKNVMMDANLKREKPRIAARDMVTVSRIEAEFSQKVI